MTLRNKNILSVLGVTGVLFAVSLQVQAGPSIRLGSLVRATSDGRLVEMTDEQARREGGETAKMSQAEAKRFCESKRKRLPTIQELARALNPRGVSTDSSFNIELHQIRKADGSFDFYFDTGTYSAPSGDIGMQKIWSSSGHPRSAAYGYAFDTLLGDIDSDGVGEEVENPNAVVCVRR
jgi:hypothetical protein